MEFKDDDQRDRHENAVAIIITMAFMGGVLLLDKFTGWFHLVHKF